MSITNPAKFYQISPVFPIEIAICLRRIYHPDGKFAAKTSLAVSSIECCQCKYCERDIRIRLGGGCGHRVMIPLLKSTSQYDTQNDYVLSFL
jgi:hypothetical protein